MKARFKLHYPHLLNQFLFGIVLIVLLVQCNDYKTNSENLNIAIIPHPVQVEQYDGEFILDQRTSLQSIGGEATAVATYLAKLISEASSFDITVQSNKDKNENHSIVLEIIDSGRKESYVLKITPKEIRITAPDSEGLFHGVQTLRQMLPSTIENKNKSTNAWRIPVAFIRDEPAYAWRGMHLDVSRHFFSVEFIKTFIDRLALYKFNRLHLHLTDDQGWRLQINQYPQLTEHGAWRILNNQDSACLKQAVINNDFALPEEFLKDKNGVKMYGGYYTQDDIRTIVSYATDRHITIVPEIDIPGHMNAAVSSFPELTCVDEGGWGKLFTVPICPCEETTYEFVGNVLEVAVLFPGEYIHIGADEVDESSWLKSKSCKDLLKKNGWKSSKELHSYFVNRVNKIVTNLGKKTIGWDEIVDGVVDSSITVMYWRGWVSKAPALAVSRGHDVIMSPTSHCYFDYEPDDKTLERMYTFNPVPVDVADPDKKKIIGLQANIWTEMIPTPSRLDYMTMPRMTALAEVGWSTAKDWEDFSSRITQHYSRWDELNIKYRLPDIPGLKKHIVFIDSALMDLKIPEGVSEIRYTVDGTAPDVNATVFTQPLRIDSSMTVKLLTLGFKRRPGNRYTIRFEKQDYLQPIRNTALKNGLTCRYFDGSYSSVSKIKSGDLKKVMVVDTLAIPTFNLANAFALEFDGLIDIAKEGIYTFYLSSDDGSTLQIGDRLVIDNDGYHGNREVGGQVALAKGLHPFKLKYFEGGGGGGLSLMYEGPGIIKQNIPNTLFKISDN
ncbi:MAG: family 20 glycosylhydrolase [Chryseolinea sp.]